LRLSTEAHEQIISNGYKKFAKSQMKTDRPGKNKVKKIEFIGNNKNGQKFRKQKFTPLYL
jgi:hypothetical protein